EAERLGYDSVWAAESWGTDAVTVLAWMAAQTTRIKVGSAIMQIPGRTPANAAMTAATLDLLSDGRFLLGLGTSGPQVVEGWHGQPWGKPLGKTREYVEIVRAALRREVVEHDGEHYRIPWDGPGATRPGPMSRSTSAGWARRGETSTTHSSAATAGRRRRSGSRSSTSPASSGRRSPRCLTSSSTQSLSSGRRSGSRSGSRRGGRRPSRHLSSARRSPRRFGRSPSWSSSLARNGSASDRPRRRPLRHDAAPCDARPEQPARDPL